MAGETLSFGAGSYDAWVFKLDATGNIEWQKTYGGPRWDRAWSVQQTSDGGYIVAGFTQSFGAGGQDFWVLKLDASGNVEWQKTYGGPADDRALWVVEADDGGYAVVGTTASFGAGYSDIWLLKLDASGNVEWEKTYGGRLIDGAASVRQTSDGGYVVAGLSRSFGASQIGGDLEDMWVLKLDPMGNLLGCGLQVLGAPSSATVMDTSVVPQDSNATVSTVSFTVRDTAAQSLDTAAKTDTQCG